MSLTEDCEIWLTEHGVNTNSLTNKQIRELYFDAHDDVALW